MIYIIRHWKNLYLADAFSKDFHDHRANSLQKVIPECYSVVYLILDELHDGTH